MKNQGKEKIKKKKLGISNFRDYSYLILFFISFSFFTFFVIRPNLITIFSLQEELGKLHILDKGYDNVIQKIISIQSFLEASRSELYLLDEAIPPVPGINKIVDDIQIAASNSAIKLNSMGISKIDLKNAAATRQKKIVGINITAVGDFPASKGFIDIILEGRRLKTVNQLVLDQDAKNGTTGGKLRITTDLESYHL